MDSLKRKRTQQRRELTFAANAFESAIQSDNMDEIDNAFLMLSETADSLFKTETAVRDIWCDSENFEEAAFETDQDKSLEYRRRWLNLQNRYRKLKKPSKTEINTTLGSVHEDYQAQNNQLPVLFQNQSLKIRSLKALSQYLAFGVIKKITQAQSVTKR
ncbi:hypothetical protein ACJJTC_019486 [Scirpophaga incertulas]